MNEIDKVVDKMQINERLDEQVNYMSEVKCYY